MLRAGPQWSLDSLFRLTISANKRMGYAEFEARLRRASTLVDIVTLVGTQRRVSADTQRLVEDRADLLLAGQLKRLRSIANVETFLQVSHKELATWQTWRACFPFNAHVAETEIRSMAQLRFSIQLTPLSSNN